MDNIDEETIDRGPKFEEQPLDTIYEPQDIRGYTSIDCYADAYPSALYSWTRERAGDKIDIDPSEDDRYTMINGRLIIHAPSAIMQDDGKYQCTARNDYGSILSSIASLTFGCKLYFGYRVKSKTITFLQICNLRLEQGIHSRLYS